MKLFIIYFFLFVGNVNTKGALGIKCKSGDKGCTLCNQEKIKILVKKEEYIFSNGKKDRTERYKKGRRKGTLECEYPSVSFVQVKKKKKTVYELRLCKHGQKGNKCIELAYGWRYPQTFSSFKTFPMSEGELKRIFKKCQEKNKSTGCELYTQFTENKLPIDINSLNLKKTSDFSDGRDKTEMKVSFRQFIRTPSQEQITIGIGRFLNNQFDVNDEPGSGFFNKLKWGMAKITDSVFKTESVKRHNRKNKKKYVRDLVQYCMFRKTLNNIKNGVRKKYYQFSFKESDGKYCAQKIVSGSVSNESIQHISKKSMTEEILNERNQLVANLKETAVKGGDVFTQKMKNSLVEDLYNENPSDDNGNSGEGK